MGGGLVPPGGLLGAAPVPGAGVGLGPFVSVPLGGVVGWLGWYPPPGAFIPPGFGLFGAVCVAPGVTPPVLGLGGGAPAGMFGLPVPVLAGGMVPPGGVTVDPGLAVDGVPSGVPPVAGEGAGAPGVVVPLPAGAPAPEPVPAPPAACATTTERPSNVGSDARRRTSARRTSAAAGGAASAA